MGICCRRVHDAPHEPLLIRVAIRPCATFSFSVTSAVAQGTAIATVSSIALGALTMAATIYSMAEIDAKRFGPEHTSSIINVFVGISFGAMAAVKVYTTVMTAALGYGAARGVYQATRQMLRL